MEKPDKKVQYTSKTFFLLAFFMFYLVYMDGTISGNSILLSIAGILFFVIGIFKSNIIRKWILHRAGIIEVDLDKKKRNRK